MTVRRTACAVLGSLALGLIVGLSLAVAGPMALGLHSYTVMSGSMEPAVHTGDVVVDEQISPLAARAGDIVTFRDPSDGRRMVTHRVRSVRRSSHGDRVDVVTKGDANNAVERWSIPARGHVGRVVYRVPKVGFALFRLRSGWGRLLFVIVPAIAFCVYELLRIWRPRRDEEGADVAPEPGAEVAPEPLPDLGSEPMPAAERLPDGETDPLPYGVPDLDPMPAPRAEERVR